MSIKRPKQHVKETKSAKILNRQTPDEWIIRKIEPDYGLDMEIEIVSGEEVTGKNLLVQVKSSKSFDYKDSFIHYPFETNKLQFYLNKDIPVILVLVDLEKEECYWLFVQEYIYNHLEKTKPLWKHQKTVTLKIPVRNLWRRSLGKLEEIANKAPLYLNVRKSISVPAETMLSWKKKSERIRELEELEEITASKSFEIGLELAYIYGKEGKDEEAVEKLWKVYNKSRLIDPLRRIRAVTALLWLYDLGNREENRKAFELALEGLKLAEEIENEPYVMYLRGFVIQAAYFKLVLDFANRTILHRVSQWYESSHFSPLLRMLISETGQKLSRLKSDYISNLREAETKEQYYIFADLLRRFALMHIFLYLHMHIWWGPKETFDLLLSAEDLFDLSLRIVDAMKREEMKCAILEDMAVLHLFKNDAKKRRQVLRQGLEIAKRIGHKGLTKEIKEKSDQYEKLASRMARLKNIDFEEPSDTEIDKAHRFLLEKAGIDINGNDELAELARVGLKDRNPERVLRYCKHLFIEIVSYGPIWEIVGLHTTGRKLLFCEKDGSLEGWKLDEVFEEFKQEYCKGCKYHSPRPKEWKWTYRWQREQGIPEAMKQLLKNHWLRK